MSEPALNTMGQAAGASVLGQRFGRYEALLRLASGGMGHVLVGRTLAEYGVSRLIAIKTILQHLVADETYVKLFVREAAIASRLHHPNVVPVLELNRTETELYLVMEYFPSVSLQTILRVSTKSQKQMPFDVACAFVADAAAGLHAAHELSDENGVALNLVHRDATPSNLLIGIDGSVKLTDFGVAKATGAQFESMTVGGDLRGKLGYLSPEQVVGVGLDRRSDLFTLGVVLWECIAGRRLFRHESELALLRAITEEDAPDVRDIAPKCPAALAQIVRRALHRDRDRRYQSAAELRQALTAQLKPNTDRARSDFAHDTIGAMLLERQRQIAAAMLELDSGTSAARRKPLAAASASLTGPHSPLALQSSSSPSVSQITPVQARVTRTSLAAPMLLAAVGFLAFGLAFAKLYVRAATNRTQHAASPTHPRLPTAHPTPTMPPLRVAAQTVEALPAHAVDASAALGTGNSPTIITAGPADERASGTGPRPTRNSTPSTRRNQRVPPPSTAERIEM